jgi:hypothetical protein
MKRLIFLPLISLIFFASCRKPLEFSSNEVYSGKLYIQTNLRSDSFNVKLNISEGQFTYLPKGCAGTYKINNNMISFTSDDCSCWCNCCTFCDCGGDNILSAFTFSLVDGHFIFTRSYGEGKLIPYTKITYDLQKE